MFLTKDELVELTGRKRQSAQIAALNTLGIIHKVRPDGLPLVLRVHVEQLFGGLPEEKKPKQAKQWEPDWDALKNARQERPRKRNEQRGAKKASTSQN
jgi:hypothetical protein